MGNFKHFGVMLDMSRNAVMRVSEVKRMLDLMKMMQYDTLGLYIEDTYEIDGEPFFGYLRGRYSKDELKDIVLYATSLGIEVIPHIQTLAHLNHLTRHRVYAPIFDMDNVLLIDEPKTYELIDKMFKTLSECFTSKNVNIGMDEAFGVGRGKYLDKHGYCDRYDMLLRHLGKVAEIARKYGFKPHMWSDMFFRIASGDYVPCEIPESVKQMLPKDVDLAYWDYYHKDKDFYDKMFNNHKEFGCDVWFAGGAWSWMGFVPLAGQSFRTMQPAMQSVNDCDIKNVMIAMWGDGGRECSFFSLIHVLYAIRQFSLGNYDMEDIAKGFKQTFGYNFDDFMLLDLPNLFSDDYEMGDPINPSRVLLYNDLFLGAFDKNIEGNVSIPYEKYAKRIADASSRVGEFGYVFNTISKLCAVLALKGELGIKIRRAYKEKNNKELSILSTQISHLVEKVEDFHTALYIQWHKDNKPQGFEVQDARLGGLIIRLKTCKKRLDSYLSGDVSVLEELEENILPQGDGTVLRSYSYRSLASMSTI